MDFIVPCRRRMRQTCRSQMDFFQGVNNFHGKFGITTLPHFHEIPYRINYQMNQITQRLTYFKNYFFAQAALKRIEEEF